MPASQQSAQLRAVKFQTTLAAEAFAIDVSNIWKLVVGGALNSREPK